MPTDEASFHSQDSGGGGGGNLTTFAGETPATGVTVASIFSNSGTGVSEADAAAALRNRWRRSQSLSPNIIW